MDPSKNSTAKYSGPLSEEAKKNVADYWARVRAENEEKLKKLQMGTIKDGEFSKNL